MTGARRRPSAWSVAFHTYCKCLRETGRRPAYGGTIVAFPMVLLLVFAGVLAPADDPAPQGPSALGGEYAPSQALSLGGEYARSQALSPDPRAQAESAPSPDSAPSPNATPAGPAPTATGDDHHDGEPPQEMPPSPAQEDAPVLDDTEDPSGGLSVGGGLFG